MASKVVGHKSIEKTGHTSSFSASNWHQLVALAMSLFRVIVLDFWEKYHDDDDVRDNNQFRDPVIFASSDGSLSVTKKLKKKKKKLYHL